DEADRLGHLLRAGDLLLALGHVGHLLDLRHLRHLGEELLIVGRVQRILVLELSGEQLEERVLTERAAGGLRERAAARARSGGDRVGSHGSQACTSTRAPAGTVVVIEVVGSSSTSSTSRGSAGRRPVPCPWRRSPAGPASPP